MQASHRPHLAIPLNSHNIPLLSGAIGAIGTEKFLRAIWDSFAIALDFDAGGVMTYFKDRPPKKGFFVYSKEKRGPVNEEGYFLGPYALDPVYRKFLGGCQSGLYRLADLAPDNFQNSEYFQNFYSRNKIVDSLEVIWNIDSQSATLLYFERETGSPLFSQLDIHATQLWIEVAFSALTKHYEFARPIPIDQVDKLFHEKVEITLEKFGSSLLTPREREVLGFMLKGYSATKTAERLATAEGTIKIHRNSIHRKLEIGTQAELFSLFIRCIPYADPKDPVDPLTRYQSPRSESS